MKNIKTWAGTLLSHRGYRIDENASLWNQSMLEVTHESKILTGT